MINIQAVQKEPDAVARYFSALDMIKICDC